VTVDRALELADSVHVDPFQGRCNFYIMIRTQIQISDELYLQAKRLADEREISLAEVVRRVGASIKDSSARPRKKDPMEP
jgi:hypothetical protein